MNRILEVKDCLQYYDSKAVDYMEEIKVKLNKFIDKSDLAKIEENIAIYEFDTALGYVNDVISKINDML